MKRSEIREAAFLLTFEKLFTDDSVDAVIDAAYEVDEFEMDEECEKLFEAVTEKAADIDEIIAANSEKRQFSRIPKVSVAILRIALYEMLYNDNIPNNVAISEAVLLAKKYTYTPDVKFINGVLGVVAKKLENKEGTEE